MSSSMITVSALSLKESTMGSSTKRPSSAISKHSSVMGTPTHIREWLMSLQADSHASPFPLQESKPEQTIAETCGPKPSPYFASYNHDSRTWRTSQVCLLTNTLDEYSETWPKAGLMLDGVCYPQPKWERRIREIGSGLLPTVTTPTGEGERSGERAGTGSLNYMARTGQLYPTPSTVDDGARFNKSPSSGAANRPTLGAMAKHNLWPTPRQSDHKGPQTKTQHTIDREAEGKASLCYAITNEEGGGKLNPTWVEWLMGWPLGWTDLKPLEMDKFQQWQQQHGRR